MSEQPIPDPGAWVRDEQVRSHLIAAEIGIRERDRIIERLREALRFYADETNYPASKPPFMQVEAYMGNRARDALARHREASGGE